MKRLLTLVLLVFLAVGLKAQQNENKEYLLFEFMKVQPGNWGDYYSVEEFWSGIHQQRVADKSILGWDMWALVPSGAKQGPNYLTVTIFASLKDMLNAVNSWDVMSYAKKAYPDKTDEELAEMMDKTVQSRELVYQNLLIGVDETKDNFQMKIGMVVTLDFMKQTDDNYEKAESEIFKPWHQQIVDNGGKGHWGLVKAILPVGSQAYFTHIAYSFYTDMNQLSDFMNGTGGEMDMMTQIAVQEGLKTREWKELKIGRLEMMVR